MFADSLEPSEHLLSVLRLSFSFYCEVWVAHGPAPNRFFSVFLWPSAEPAVSSCGSLFGAAFRFSAKSRKFAEIVLSHIICITLLVGLLIVNRIFPFWPRHPPVADHFNPVDAVFGHLGVREQSTHHRAQSFLAPFGVQENFGTEARASGY